MKKIFLLLSLTLTWSYAQEKTQLDFLNERTPIFPGCENSIDKFRCLVNGFGDIIISRLNEEHKVKSIDPEKIQIQLSIRIEKDGKTTVKQVSTSDQMIQELASSALKNVPMIQPLYSERDKTNGASSHSFYIHIQKNKTANNFEIITPAATEDPAKKPYPNFELSKNIGFKGCENERKENFSKCFNEQISIWVSERISQRLLKKFKGQKAKLKLMFDRDGILNLTVITESSEIKKELTRIFEDFPQVLPAETTTEKITVSYHVPISF